MNFYVQTNIQKYVFKLCNQYCYELLSFYTQGILLILTATGVRTIDDINSPGVKTTAAGVKTAVSVKLLVLNS